MVVKFEKFKQTIFKDGFAMRTAVALKKPKEPSNSERVRVFVSVFVTLYAQMKNGNVDLRDDVLLIKNRKITHYIHKW